MGSDESKPLTEEALESLRDWGGGGGGGGGSATRSIGNLKISTRDLLKIKKRVIEEYPYFSKIYESVLITDVRKPDNPIVFVNDNFEKMTLYTREEVLGRNCRFLQGRYTDRAVVSKVREACMKGEQLDVELLNYRKDGVPFWNRFLLLPLHKSDLLGNRKVTHFVAVQKDVTFLRKNDSRLIDWPPVEVALWLDTIGLSHYGNRFIEQKIDGARLMLLMSNNNLSLCGISDVDDQKTLMTQLKSLEQGKTSVSLYRTLKESILSLPSNQKEEFSWNTPENRMNVNQLGVALKCTYRGTTYVLLVSSSSSYKKFQQQLYGLYPEGHYEFHIRVGSLNVENDDDLRKLITISKGNTMTVALSDSNQLRTKEHAPRHHHSKKSRSRSNIGQRKS